MLPRLRAWLGSAVAVAACGFDSSGHGNEAAEIGESADPDASADDDAGPTGDGTSATTIGGTGATDASASTSTTTGDSVGPEDSGSSSTDEGTTGPIEWGPFGDPIPIGELNTTWLEDDPTLRGDLLEIYFGTDRSGTSEDIWVAIRDTPDGEFYGAMPVGGDVNDPYASETTPELSPNGRVLAFASTRGGGAGQLDIYVTTRDAVGAPWSAVMRLEELATYDHEGGFARTQDERTGYFCRNVGGFQEELLRTTRPEGTGPWGMPQNLSINTDSAECSPWIDPAGERLWFNSQRDGGEGGYDLWWAAIAGDTIDPPQAVVELNTEYQDEDPWLSPQGDLIVFASDRDGSMDLFFAVRAPL